MVNFRLFVMNIDGTGAHRLDARGRTDEDPAWSPEFTNQEILLPASLDEINLKKEL